MHCTLAIAQVSVMFVMCGLPAHADAPRYGAFDVLPVGEVQPRGWLLEQIARDADGGYGPVLDELTDRCEVGVFDCREKSKMSKPTLGEVWWNGETTGNWLDGLIRTTYLSSNEVAKQKVDDIVHAILAMQEEDGYLGTYPEGLRFEQPIKDRNGELWSQTCLYRALLAYYELTGNGEVLEAVERAAKLVLSHYGKARPYWGTEKLTGGPGHNLMFVDICEWLFRITGDRSYVAFARFLYDGYSAAPGVREKETQRHNLADPGQAFRGHGAHVMEHLRVPLFVYHATRDDLYREAAGNCFTKTFPHLNAGGACVSDEAIGARPGSAHLGCEYCTMLEWLSSLQSGVQKTGQSSLADRIERLAYNAAEGARQLDGKAIQYCTLDNQYEAMPESLGGRLKLSPTHDDIAVCCPVTALKFFPYFVSGLWMRLTGEEGFAGLGYAPNCLETTVGDVAVAIESATKYPFEDTVEMTVSTARPVSFTLRLRVPGWSKQMSVTARGAEVARVDCWYTLRKVWQSGDHISIRFESRVERKAMASGEVYWQRGPLVFSLPILGHRKAVRHYDAEDFADYTYAPVPEAFWDYLADRQSAQFAVKRLKVAGDPWAEPSIRLVGKLLNRRTLAAEQVELLPMGVCLLRRTAFTLAPGDEGTSSTSPGTHD